MLKLNRSGLTPDVSTFRGSGPLKALEVFDRTQSATKTVRELGYPGRWTLHRWIRERDEPPAAPIRRTTLKRYPLATKLKAVELFTAGMSPDAIASELSLNSKMSVYAWAQRFREEGKWGLMSATERKRSAFQMRVFGTGVLGTRYCRVPGSWYRAEGCVGPDRLS